MDFKCILAVMSQSYTSLKPHWCMEFVLGIDGLSGFEKLAVIKKVLPHLSADASFISRFVDEAQVAIKLQHVNVAQVFEEEVAS